MLQQRNPNGIIITNTFNKEKSNSYKVKMYFNLLKIKLTNNIAGF